MLEYDNSAFYYFAITLLIIYALPGTFYVLSEVFAAFIWTGSSSYVARTAEEKLKSKELERNSSGLARLRTVGFTVNLGCVIVAWILLYFLFQKVVRDGQVSSFDPFLILGVSPEAKLAEIKKAFRTLSLKYHPDKNPGDKSAEEMFMKVAKAYEALTDPVSMKNFKEFGNPDGKQALEVSIGLPTALLENPKTVLVIYLLGMVVVVPSVVGLWYSYSKQFGDKNVLYDTYNAFYQVLSAQHRVKTLVEVLAVAKEFRQLNSTFVDKSTGKPSSDPDEASQRVLDQLLEALKSEKSMVKPKLGEKVPAILRGNILLHGHLSGLTRSSSPKDTARVPLTPSLATAQREMLRRCPELLEGLLEIAQMRKFFDASLSIVQLQQFVVQGLWIGDDSLMQLPHLTTKSIARIKDEALQPRVERLADFLKLDDEDKLRRVGFTTTQPEAKDLLAACSAMPRLSVETQLFVEEDDVDEDGENNAEEASSSSIAGAAVVSHDSTVRGDTILEQDLVTLRVTLTRENVKAEASSAASKKGKNNKKQKQATIGPAYAPRFPAPVQEGWWILLLDRHSAAGHGDVIVHAFEHVTSQDRCVKHEIRFMAPPRVGDYEFELQILSDCYLGLDVAQSLKFTVRPQSDLPEYRPHEEDLNLDNEPTLFEQLAAQNADDSSDDDSDDEDDKKPTQTVKPSVARANHESGKKESAASVAPVAGGKKQAVKVVDVDSDEEDDD